MYIKLPLKSKIFPTLTQIQVLKHYGNPILNP